VEGMTVWQGLEAPCQSHPPFPSISQKHDRKKNLGSFVFNGLFPIARSLWVRKKPLSILNPIKNYHENTPRLDCSMGVLIPWICAKWRLVQQDPSCPIAHRAELLIRDDRWLLEFGMW
jgi:hypothetical protein